MFRVVTRATTVPKFYLLLPDKKYILYIGFLFVVCILFRGETKRGSGSSVLSVYQFLIYH